MLSFTAWSRVWNSPGAADEAEGAVPATAAVIVAVAGVVVAVWARRVGVSGVRLGFIITLAACGVLIVSLLLLGLATHP